MVKKNEKKKKRKNEIKKAGRIAFEASNRGSRMTFTFFDIRGPFVSFGIRGGILF